MSEHDKSSKSKWETFSEQEETAAEKNEAISGEIDDESREQLEGQLTALEQQVIDYKDKIARVHAEVENIRRRAERDVVNAHKYANEKLLLDLLPVVDSLLHGLESPESEDPHAKGMREGLNLTLALLYKTLEKHGVVIISPQVGEVFDPSVHEALSMQPDPNAKANTILAVIQKGYQLNGRVLRAARVLVAA